MATIQHETITHEIIHADDGACLFCTEARDTVGRRMAAVQLIGIDPDENRDEYIAENIKKLERLLKEDAERNKTGGSHIVGP